jgi:hypothetical protein
MNGRFAMDKLKEKTGKELLSEGSHVLLKAPRGLVVWLGLVGFVLGVVFCAFNPSNSGREDLQSGKEREAMTSSMVGAAKTIEVRAAEAKTPVNMETATFALG